MLLIDIEGSAQLPFNRAVSVSIKIIAVAFVFFHLYTAVTGTLGFLQQRPIHVLFALTLTFALVNARGREERTKIPIWDLGLIALTLLSTGYILIRSEFLMANAPLFRMPLEFPLAVIMVLLLLEAGRRRIGLTFPILTSVAMLYAVFGHLIPGHWGHAPISAKYMLEALYISSTGIWGLLTGLSATVIAMFIIFGAFILFTEGGQTLVELSIALAGRMWGGAAKVAAVASAFFGMISGSAIANTAATGNFTIPLMKRLGYSSEFAGAVEATASTGGIFTPPVMGATAFILAEFVGLPYVRVMGAAMIPAFLFFFGVFFSIDHHARKLRLAPVPPELIPPLRSAASVRKLAPVVIPAAVLVGALLTGFSAFYSAFWGCCAALFMYLVTTPSIAAFKARLKTFVDGLEAAGKTLANVVPLLACAAIVIGLISLTGIGVKFSELIMSLGQAHILLALVMGAIVAIILGMGLPAAAAFVLCAAVVAPGLVKLGVWPLAAHMFILYYACISGITPPVCPNVFVASAIAGSNWLKTAWQAVRLAFIIYIIPFIFVFAHPLLMEGSVTSILTLFVAATWATFLLTIGFGGFFLTNVGPILRLVFFASAILILLPIPQFTAVGAVLSVLAMFLLLRRWFKSRREAPLT